VEINLGAAMLCGQARATHAMESAMACSDWTGLNRQLEEELWVGFLAHPNTDTVRKHSSVCHKADIPVWSTENGVFDRRHRSLQVRQGNWMR
jgi:hypothetical protein